MSKHLESMNITYAQLMVIRVIDAEPGITAKEILMKMDTDKATLSGIISRLERDDYIYRVKNKKDGRVRNIFLAGGSKDICNRVVEIETGCVKELFRGISDEDAKEFVRILDLLILNLESNITE
jgi:DNA-binding MarR family transcriptional regulator